MQFENTFSVDAPIDRVWSYLLDVQAVAPCVPGAELTEIVSDTEFKGTVKVKLGAVQVSYKGTLALKEVDEAGRKVVLVASGNETRGSGSASGTVTSHLVAESAVRTSVRIVSEVNITGRVAQFGRNIMQDVSNRLIREFAKCVESNLVAREAQLPPSLGSTAAGTDESAATRTAPEHPAGPGARPQAEAELRPPSTNPEFGAPSTNPEFGAPSPNPEPGAPSTNPEFGAPSTNPEFGAPSANTDSGGRSANPEFGGPSTNPEFGGPFANANSAARSTNPEFGGPSTNPEFSARSANPPGSSSTDTGSVPRPATPPSPPYSEAEPLKLMPLLIDIARSRLAAALRALAKLVEPPPQE